MRHRKRVNTSLSSSLAHSVIEFQTYSSSDYEREKMSRGSSGLEIEETDFLRSPFLEFLHFQLSLFLTSAAAHSFCLFSVVFTANFSSLLGFQKTLAMEKWSIPCLTDSSSFHSPLQYRRLHTTESDLDQKMKAIMILLEEDLLIPARRGGTNQNRKQQIKYMLEEYYRSYQSMAEKYDCLRSIFANILHSGPSSSSDAEKFQSYINSSCKPLEGTHAHSKMSSDVKTIAADGSFKSNNDNFDGEYLIKLRDELMLSKSCSQNFEEIVQVRDNKEYGRNTCHADTNDTALKMNKFEVHQVTEVYPPVTRWKKWNELNSQVTSLTVENLQHQEELAKRNNEKREAIKELQQQIERLKSENRALQISLRFSRGELKPQRSPISRLAEMISSKILRRDHS